MEREREAASQATVRDLVTVIFRQKWVILTVFLVTTLSVLLLNLRTPTTYQSLAKVRVERARPETSLRPGVRVLPWSEEIASELETVKSYPVAQRAQQILDQWYEEGKVSKKIRLSRSAIGARVIGESNVLEVSYTSQEASVCRPVTDAVAKAYRRFRQESIAVPQAKKFFEREIAAVVKDLDDLQKEEERYLAVVGSAGVKARQASLSTLLQNAEADLMEVKTNRSLLARKLDQARALVNAEDYDATFFSQLKYQSGWAIKDLKKDLIDAKLERDRLSATLTPEHPKLRQAEQQYQTAKAMLEDEIRSTLSYMENEYRQLTEKQSMLAAQVADLRTQLAAIPQVSVELSRLDSEIAFKRDQLKDLKSKQIATQVTLATSPKYTVTVLVPASPPYAMKTRDYVRMALAPLMSLVVGFLLAFFLDSLDHSLRTSADVEEHLGLPVLAALPESRD